MDRESPELIEREMEQTRESLTEKVSLLEEKVVGQIQSATDTVQGTVDSVQETVHTVKSAITETVQSVSQTVRDTAHSVADRLKEGLDVSGHVQRNPWGMVAGASAAGFVAGMIIFRRPSTGASRLPAYAPAAASPAPSGSHSPKWLNDLFDMAMGEFKQIAQQALTTASASLKQTVQAGVPKLIESALSTGGQSAGCKKGTDGAAQEFGSPNYAGDLRQ